MAAERLRLGAACAHEGRSIVALQRSRLIDAAVGVLGSEGHAGTSVAAVCERAGVSRRTFYEVFEDREQCLAAILSCAEQRFIGTIEDLGLGGLGWIERVRLGLWAILCLADGDPLLARACLVETQGVGGIVRSERERILSRLVDVVDEGRSQSKRAPGLSRLTAEALVGAVCSVLAARLVLVAGSGDVDRRRRVDRAGEGLRGLLGELAGMIVLPYLGDALARQQSARSLPEELVLGDAGVDAAATSVGVNPLAGLPIRLTYRTARVLQAVALLAEDGVEASNRRVADHAGVVDAGQISKLLSRLHEHGLLENLAALSQGHGEANRWQLTQVGRRVVQSITQEVQSSWQRSAA